VKELEHFPERLTFSSHEHQFLNADEIDGPSTEQFHENGSDAANCSRSRVFTCPFSLPFWE
jgi:hypothetical protein